MKRISIVTITYNAERTLQRTLDSVLHQSYPHIEHLIVDGASKDATLAIAEKYRAQSPHEIVIQSEPDRGLYDAMNKGLQKATGDYVVFLNAGDSLYASDTIDIVVRHTADEVAVIYGDTAITDGEGRFLHLRTHRPPEHLSWKSFKKGMLVCHQAFYVRTDIARQQPYKIILHQHNPSRFAVNLRMMAFNPHHLGNGIHWIRREPGNPRDPLRPDPAGQFRAFLRSPGICVQHGPVQRFPRGVRHHKGLP